MSQQTADNLKVGDVIEFSTAQATVTKIEVMYRLTYAAEGRPHIMTVGAAQEFELAAQQGLL